MTTYNVIRFRFDGGGEREVIETGLTLEEARAHCQREDTHGEGWFDGYEEVNDGAGGTLYTDATCIEAVNDGEELPEAILDPETQRPALTLGYVRTDAWRGYYEPSPIKGSGWREDREAGGWMTGDYDDAPEHARSSNVKARLEALAETRDVLAVFTPSSNVFSTIVSVFVRESEDREQDAEREALIRLAGSAA